MKQRNQRLGFSVFRIFSNEIINDFAIISLPLQQRHSNIPFYTYTYIHVYRSIYVYMYVLVTKLLGNHRQNISLAQTKTLQALVVYSFSISPFSSAASAGMTAHKPMAAPGDYTDPRTIL